VRGLDTNVLVRLITGDNPDQASAVLSLLEEAEVRNERFFVSTIVVCELAWTLRSRPYQFRRAAIAEALVTVLETHLFEIQDRELTQQAVAEYREGRADFSDYLIGRENARAGCSDTITLDGDLSKVEGFALLSVP
jgi:predicted nucleic-acid-binding protein